MGKPILLTNHALVLYWLAREPGLRLRDLADRVGVTERAATRIVVELSQAGYVSRHRLGRRSFYELHADAPLQERLDHPRTVGDLLSIMLDRPPVGPRGPASRPPAA